MSLRAAFVQLTSDSFGRSSILRWGRARPTLLSLCRCFYLLGLKNLDSVSFPCLLYCRLSVCVCLRLYVCMCTRRPLSELNILLHVYTSVWLRHCVCVYKHTFVLRWIFKQPFGILFPPSPRAASAGPWARQGSVRCLNDSWRRRRGFSGPLWSNLRWICVITGEIGAPRRQLAACACYFVWFFGASSGKWERKT